MFENKIIGMAPSSRLGVIRAIIVLCALINVVFQDFGLLAQTVAPWYHPDGFLKLASAFPTGIFLGSEILLLIFKSVLIISLGLAFVGFRTQIALTAATLLYFIYMAIFHSATGSLDNGILPLYLMFLMIWIPTGEGFSIDQRCRKDYAHLRLDDRPSTAIAWSVFLVRAVLVFSYFQSGIAKIQNTGLGWIRPSRFRQFMIEDSLIFSHTAWIPHLVQFSPAVWAGLACVYLGLELFFPLLLLVRDLRVLYPLAAVLVRSFTLFPQNVFFHDLILLQFVFYDWDRILPLTPLGPQDRRHAGFFQKKS